MTAGATAERRAPGEAAPGIAFQLRGVRQEKNGRVLLREVDLVIRRGRATAVLGPSGAGKTSLLRLLDRLDDPVAGEVRYRDRPLSDYPVAELRRRVGFVFQVPVLFPGSVRDNLRVAADLAGVAEAEFEGRATEALGRTALDPSLLDRPGEELSVGQRQRAALARALLMEPEVLVLDEPTSALDPETSERLLETIRGLIGKTAMTVVLSIHRPNEAAAVADDAVLLAEGTVREAGPAARILDGSRGAT